MRREGRLHGWVYPYELCADPLDSSDDGKRRAMHTVTGPMANDGFMRVSRKITNHPKSTGGDLCKEYGKRSTRKGRQKFKYDKVKMYYLDGGVYSDSGVDM